MIADMARLELVSKSNDEPTAEQNCRCINARTRDAFSGEAVTKGTNLSCVFLRGAYSRRISHMHAVQLILGLNYSSPLAYTFPKRLRLSVLASPRILPATNIGI